MDVLALVGIIIGVIAVIGGNMLEGGSLSTLANGSAALVVFGGTIGAAVLQTQAATIVRAVKMLSWVIKPPRRQIKSGIKTVITWSNTARKKGLLGLEVISEKEKDPFKKKGLQLLVDGSEPETIRYVLETDMLMAEQRDLDAASFYESMGGYAPTIGIIGAVIGLIHVMRHLSDPSQLGPGIAVAFVATIYGVAFANLFLLPVANKLKACVKEKSFYRELTIEGLCAIADGENPKNIELKLSGYLH